MTFSCGCPAHFPDWNGQDVDIGGTLVHNLSIPTLIHMPLAYGVYLGRQQQMITQLGLKERWPGLVLTRTGFFRGSLVRLLENERSPASNLKVLPRPFMVHAVLHHGNLSTGHKVIQQMQINIIDAGHRPKELYLCYLTCLRCAEERGGGKILFLRRWEESALLQRRLKGETKANS